MTHLSPAIAATPLVLVALTGCSPGSSASASHEGSVPAGVEEQYDVLAEEVAEKGQTVESGDWTVHLITETAEPWFEVRGRHGESFREPRTSETDHIEIIPTETATGRIVPDVPITVEVVDADGSAVQRKGLEFFHSTFFHYADNFSVPRAGDYTIRATLGVPTFNRHGEEEQAPALAEGTTVEFTDVELGVR